MPRDKPSQGVTMLNPFLDETDSSDEEADANTNEPVKNKGYLNLWCKETTEFIQSYWSLYEDKLTIYETDAEDKQLLYIPLEKTSAYTCTSVPKEVYKAFSFPTSCSKLGIQFKFQTAEVGANQGKKVIVVSGLEEGEALSVTGMEHMVTLSARLCAVECGHGRREIPIGTTLLDAVAMIKWAKGSGEDTFDLGFFIEQTKPVPIGCFRLQYAEHEQVFAQGCDNEESEEWVASLKLGCLAAKDPLLTRIMDGTIEAGKTTVKDTIDVGKTMAAAALQIASKAVKKTEGHVKEHKYCGCLFMKHSNLSEHKHHKHAVKMKKLKQKQEALLSQGAEIDNPMNDIGPPIIDEDASQPFSSTSTAVIGELASSKQNSFADAWGKNKKVTKFDSHAVAVGFAAKLKQAKKHAKELKDNPAMKALEMKQKMEAKRVKAQQKLAKKQHKLAKKMDGHKHKQAAASRMENPMFDEDEDSSSSDEDDSNVKQSWLDGDAGSEQKADSQETNREGRSPAAQRSTEESEDDSDSDEGMAAEAEEMEREFRDEQSAIAARLDAARAQEQRGSDDERAHAARMQAIRKEEEDAIAAAQKKKQEMEHEIETLRREAEQVAQRRVREQALEDRQEDQKQAKETARRAAEERANELARQQVAEQDNKERMEKAAGERFEKEQELAALQAARKARELGRIPVGSKVRLTSTATLTRCLKALDAIGELVGDDGKGNMPYHVKSDAGKASWYAENDIREVFGEDASAAATQPADAPAAAAPESELTDAVTALAPGEVTIEGRAGTIVWDGRPAKQYIKVKWSDDGTTSKVIKASKIDATAPAPSPSVSKSASSTPSYTPPAKVSATASTASTTDLHNFLASLNLEKFEQSLQELGADSTEDLTLMDDDDLAAIPNLRPLQKKKLKLAISQLGQ